MLESPSVELEVLLVKLVAEVEVESVLKLLNELLELVTDVLDEDEDVISPELVDVLVDESPLTDVLELDDDND